MSYLFLKIVEYGCDILVNSIGRQRGIDGFMQVLLSVEVDKRCGLLVVSVETLSQCFGIVVSASL